MGNNFIHMILTVLGGTGLFLLGMILMTDGLKAIAGETLRRVLGRFTGNRLSALLSGAAVTSIIQSSGATIVAAIGFVSAGLMTFPQAVGVIFGANIGTTSTSWIVALLGFKLKIKLVAFVLVGIGAAMKLVARERIAFTGLVLCGFGLIFVGIDFLQDGLKNLSFFFDPAAIGSDTLLSRIILILIGAAMTVLMQSSSAAIAATLTALHAGTITLEQAACMCIGQNIGTTLTVAVVSIGASTPSKRTAIAHIMFNVITSIAVFLLLPVFIRGSVTITERIGFGSDATIILSVFHTLFNLSGAALLLPASGSFARLIERMYPDREIVLTRNLNTSVANIAPVAIEAARRTVIDIASVVLGIMDDYLNCRSVNKEKEIQLSAIESALDETERFMGRVYSKQDASDVHERHIYMLHAIEHINILAEACREREPIDAIARDPMLRSLALDLSAKIVPILEWMKGDMRLIPVLDFEKTSTDMTELRKKERSRILEMTASGDITPDNALKIIEAIRWLDKTAYRIWRAVYYLSHSSFKSKR